jgi:hypothetical protein
MKRYCLPGLLVLVCCLAIAQNHSVRLDDDSDWWSLVRREVYPDPDQIAGIKPQHTQLPASNFRILGVNIGDSPATALGDATEVKRGDAASGRSQHCYVSEAGNVHLIFEQGEIINAFILFQGGPDWKGSDSCLVSPKLSENVATARGLKLGMSVQEVKAILGAPNLTRPDKLIYYITFRRVPGPKDPKAAEFIEVEDYIEVHFENSRLSYLAVSRTETA